MNAEIERLIVRTPLLLRLQDEHRAISAVCALIERLTDARRGVSDQGLVRLALEYLRDYPEWHHHPREERLFALAVERDPLLDHVFKKVMGEHDALPSDTARLIDRLDKTKTDDDGERVELAHALKAYVAEQRRHYEREDREIFPRLRGLLDDSAWSMPPRDPSLPADPVVDDEDPGRFRPLVAALLA